MFVFVVGARGVTIVRLIEQSNQESPIGQIYGISNGTGAR